METAVLICGLIPNNFHKYYDSINKTVIKPFNSDIFISTWKTELNDDVFALYKPKLYRIEDLNDISIKSRQNSFLYFLKEKGNKGNRSISLNGRYPMFYKIYDVNILRKEYEEYKKKKYDLIIRIRFDLSFEHKHEVCTKGPFLFNKIDEEEIKDSLNNNILYLRKDNEEMNAVWDQFAFSNSENMDVYCNTFLNLEQLTEERYLNSEEILFNNLKNNNTNIKHTKTVYDIKIYDKQ